MEFFSSLSTLTKIGIIDVGIQWSAFGLAALLQTERFYDFTGTGSYIILGWYSYSKSNGLLRQKIVTGMMITWAFRLGTYLVRRIIRDKSDRRFDKVKSKPEIFFIYWTFQAVWVFLTALPVFILNQNNDYNPRLNQNDYIGWALWAFGFTFEAIADQQKWNFRSLKENKSKFITSGLWKYSRHPNYFGEILLWIGTYMSCRSAYRGWENIGILGPIFVSYLLTRVSGIPMLERHMDKTWKGNLQYEEYKRRTSILIPMPPGK